MRYAVIPAAGSGRRFGGKKQFFEVRGIPLVEYSLKIFERSEFIHGVVLVLPESDLRFGEELKEKYKKVKFVVAGGEERQSSVFNGLKVLRDLKVKEVVVHDGVRPLITDSLIRELVIALSDYEVDGVIPGIKPRDTVKEVGVPLERGDFFVKKTLDRDKLVLVQTPQVFLFDVLYKCHQLAEKEEFFGTDDASLLERYGYNVVSIPGEPFNIKVTTPSDLKFVEFFLSYLSSSG